MEHAGNPHKCWPLHVSKSVSYWRDETTQQPLMPAAVSGIVLHTTTRQNRLSGGLAVLILFELMNDDVVSRFMLSSRVQDRKHPTKGRTLGEQLTHLRNQRVLDATPEDESAKCFRAKPKILTLSVGYH